MGVRTSMYFPREGSHTMTYEAYFSTAHDDQEPLYRKHMIQEASYRKLMQRGMKRAA